MKKFLAIILFLCIAAFAVTACAECDHEWVNDWCTKCGTWNVVSFDAGSITFFTSQDNVAIYDQPTSQSNQINTISGLYSPVEVTGITRNFAGNVWMRTNYGYIKLENNLMLDFGTLVTGNYNTIASQSGGYNQLQTFCNLVKPGGRADYKAWLDPKTRSIPYQINVGSQGVQTWTAEQLGNIHYGFLGRAIGLNSNTILYAGGAVNLAGNATLEYFAPKLQQASIYCLASGSFLFNPFCVVDSVTINVALDIYQVCSQSYCDTREDASDVQTGIRYFEEGI